MDVAVIGASLLRRWRLRRADAALSRCHTRSGRRSHGARNRLRGRLAWWRSAHVPGRKRWRAPALSGRLTWPRTAALNGWRLRQPSPVSVVGAERARALIMELR